MRGSKDSFGPEERVWYDQFTSTDWVHDSIADAYRVKALRSRKDIRGRIKAFFDGTQGWILSALVGFLTAAVAYVVDVSEAPVYDWKEGYCQNGFLLSEKVCAATFLVLKFNLLHRARPGRTTSRQYPTLKTKERILLRGIREAPGPTQPSMPPF